MCPVFIYAHLITFSNIRSILSNRTYSVKINLVVYISKFSHMTTMALVKLSNIKWMKALCNYQNCPAAGFEPTTLSSELDLLEIRQWSGHMLYICIFNHIQQPSKGPIANSASGQQLQSFRAMMVKSHS